MMDVNLHKAITNFLIDLPLLQNKEGRQATLLSAGLQEALPHIDLSGTPYEFVARSVDRLETYTTLADGQFALVCLLQEIGNQLGTDRRETVHAFCQQLQTQLKPRPIALLSSQRPITYLAPFQAPPLPQHFVPRPEVTDALKARLLNNEPTMPGILVVSAIHGLGGIGKSTLAAALTYDKEIQDRFPDGILWATLGQQPEILSLISGWIQAMRDYDFRPTNVEAASAHLRTLMQNKAVLLVVDDVWQPEHAKHFKVGGPHCQVLITTRRADVADEVGAELHQMDVMTPEQALELLAAHLDKTTWEETERTEALLLAKAVGYLPLALELAAVRVLRGVSWAELRQALEQEIARLDMLEGSVRKRRTGGNTLEASFNLSLNALRQDDERAWQAFVWLGVLPEDVQIAAPMATTLWNVTETEATDILEFLWNDALLLPAPKVLVGKKEWSAYRIHDLLHDIARKLLTTNQPEGLGFPFQNAHAKLLERYKRHIQNGLWHTLPDDGYVHAHLTWHFQQAGQTEQIHRLLWEETAEGRNGWYETRERLDQIAGFLEDMDLAWKMAKYDQKISLQCRYTLILTSLNSLSRNIPGELLIALVQHGLWSPVHGVAYARQVPTAELFIELSPYLPQELRDIVLHDALTIVQGIKDERHRVAILTKLVPCLSNALLGEVLEITQTIKNELWRAIVLVTLIPQLPETSRMIALQEALTVAQEISDNENRAMLLTALLSHLPETSHPTVLHEALTAAQAIKEETTRVRVLIGLLPYLPETSHPTVLHEALTAAQAIKEETIRVQVLVELLPYLPETSRTIALQDALTAARTSMDNENRATLLTTLLPHLPETLRTSVLQEALTLTLAIEEVIGRAGVLSRLSPYLPESLRADTVQNSLNALIAEPMAFEDEGIQVSVLTELIPYLPYELRPSAIEKTLSIAMGLFNNVEREMALIDLASYLPEVLLREVLTELQRLEEKWARASALTRIVPYLPETLHTSVLQDALHAAQLIEDESKRAELLATLAPYLPEELLQKVLTAIRAIKDGQRQVVALTELAPHLPETLRTIAFQEALMVIKTIEDKPRQVIMLTELIPHLSDALRTVALQNTLMVIQTIKEERRRIEALTLLAPYLPDSLLRDVLMTVQTIDNVHRRTATLTELIPHLPKDLRTAIIIDVWTAIQSSKEEWRIQVFNDLLPYLPEALLRDALIVAQTIKPADKRAKTLTGLASHLSGVLCTIAIQDALTAVQTIKDNENRAMLLTELIPLLPETSRMTVLQEALTLAQAIEEKSGQARVLTGLAYHLPEPLRVSVLQDALTATRAIKKEWSRGRNLSKLIPYLPDALLREALIMAQAFNDERSGVEVLTALAQRLIKCPTTELLSLWHSLLPRLAQRSRPDLLSDLRALTPVIVKLGGQEAIIELFHAIQDVGRWWP